MIISMILLTGFVSYWLIGQYKDQKLLLHKKMSHELFVSHTAVKDSLILRKIRPMIRDSLGKNLHFFSDQILEVRAMPDSAHAISYGVHYQGTAEKDSASIHIITAKRDEIFFKGVELVMEITNDTLSSLGMGRGLFLAEEDSQQVLLTFTDRVREFTGHDFHATWLVDSVRDAGRKKAGQFYLTIKEEPYDQLVEVDRVFAYLIGQMVPQILFALFLLLLSGSAFYFTRRSLQRQIELHLLRNEFVSNISHELKTPVATVKVALEALQHYDRIDDPETTREYLSMAQSELDRLEYLTHKVLIHSRLESGQFIERMEAFDLADLCEKVISRFQPKLAEMHADLTFAAADRPVTMHGAVEYIDGVIVNLIDNAMKYGGQKPQIEVALCRDDQEVRLAVSDRGPGIPDAFKGRIFEKFFRIPSDNRHNVKGHGMGLSYAALVMQEHQGTIVVRDRKGGGAVFELVFPFRHEG